MSSDRVSLAARTDAAVFARYRRTRDPAAREALATRFLPLARQLASRYVGRAERDDLEQVASVALLKAIERYDPDRGPAFSSFAVPTILGELRRYFRDHGWSVHVPRDVQELSLRLGRVTEALTGELGRTPTAAELARRCDATVEQVLEARASATAHHPDSLDRPRLDDEEGDPAATLGGREDPQFARVEDADVLDGLLALLPERERLILHLRFGRELTQAEIGARLGLSQMHVSRIIRRSIDTLRHAVSHPRAGGGSDTAQSRMGIQRR